jgi:hypothetical protein
MKVAMLLIASLTLTSCVSSPIKFKDATHRTNTHIVTDAPEADTIIVDLRDKVKDPKTEEYIVKNPRIEVTDTSEDSPQSQRRLFWFFFLMMFLGLFGAGIMGGIDVFANRKSNKEGKNVPIQRKTKKGS